MTPSSLTPEQARHLAAGPLGRELARFAQLYAVPVHSRSGSEVVCSGTTFFIDCGAGVFGVTAGHVYDRIIEQTASGSATYLGFNGVPVHWRERLIARGRTVDLATYRVHPTEVEASRAKVLTNTTPWPPPPPSPGQGLLLAGFPGVDRRLVTESHVEFGAFSAMVIADSINERDISCVINRDEWIPIDGIEFPPEGFDFAGMSGAPVLAFAGAELIAPRLAGVVYECGRHLLEVFKIARADYIAADGSVREP